MEVRIVKVSVWERKRCVNAACFYSPHAFTCFSLPERVTQPDETPSDETPAPELAKDFGNCQLRNRWSFFCFFREMLLGFTALVYFVNTLENVQQLVDGASRDHISQVYSYTTSQKDITLEKQLLPPNNPRDVILAFPNIFYSINPK